MVLHRLEGADSLAELLPLAGVLYGQVYHALRQTQGLGGAAQRTAIQRTGDQRLRLLAFGDHGGCVGRLYCVKSA